ncbi:MAG: alpha/beta fold hydrolase, partial [Thermoanaerobaculia bacterium]|nr:alpha/beta fold hydrolase [Thermoanaerobaculia bacterium]
MIFVPGSGDGPRTHFRHLADWYAGKGFVVLTYDKRGSGDSSGSWISSSLEDLAADLAAGLALLDARAEVDRNAIGVWAISQGGWVLPVSARMSDVPDWAIVVSGGGASPRETELFAYRASLSHGGIDEAGREAAVALVDAYLDYLGTGRDRDDVVAAIDAAKTKPWYRYVALDRIMPSSEEGRSNWEWVANFDAVAASSEISFPVLAMIGGKDPNLPPDAALAGWREAFAASGVDGSKVVFFPEAGHGLGRGGHGAAMR